LSRAALPVIPLIFAVLLFVVGCRDEQRVRVYSVEKEDHAWLNESAGMPRSGDGLPPGHPPIDSNHMHDTAPTGPVALAFDLPEGWQRTMPGSRFIEMEFAAPAMGATARVTVSRQRRSGLLMNINRWRGQQLGIAPVTEQTISDELGRLDTRAGPAMLMDEAAAESSSKPGTRMIVAIIPHGRTLWIVKLWEPAEVAAAVRDELLAFVRSIRFEAATTQPTDPPVRVALIIDDPPTGWRRMPDDGSGAIMLRYIKANHEAGILIGRYGGTATERLMILNGFRRQFGLEPLRAMPESADGATVTAMGERFDLRSLGGEIAEGVNARVLVAFIDVGDVHAVAAISGLAETVTEQSDAFATVLAGLGVAEEADER
jgi:hypothetical protein